mmetsp:Transcript_12841/g.23246  ORF Transcript_12841/g.23246 Transcript_12841/m.23246 type:complete len:211 (+) Transcript_12841:2106-2738(+)
MLGHFLKEWLKGINVIIARFVLQQRRQPFQSHSRINVLRRQRRQSRLIPIVLNKHNVPNLNQIRIIGIDQCRCIPIPNPIIMKLRAWSTWPRVTHLPEIVFGVACNDTFFGKVFEPELAGFFVGFEAQTGVAFKVGGIETVWINVVDLGQKFPGVINGFLFEVISKGPGAQHFKEGMMVGITPHIVQIVVFSSGPNALLRIGRSRQFAQR